MTATAWRLPVMSFGRSQWPGRARTTSGHWVAGAVVPGPDRGFRPLSAGPDPRQDGLTLSGATGELPAGADTPVWLATSDEPGATVTGRYLKSRREQRATPAAYNTGLQDALLAACAT